MNLNEVRIAEDKDFEVLKIYLSRNDGWNLNFQKGQTAVWTRQAPESEFAMIRVRMILSCLYNRGIIGSSEKPGNVQLCTLLHVLEHKESL